MRILGINPGVRGGLGIVEVNNGVHRSSSNAIDVQTVGIGAKERIDAITMRGWIQTYRPDHAAIERSTWKKFHHLHGGDKEPARPARIAVVHERTRDVRPKEGSRPRRGCVDRTSR